MSLISAITDIKSQSLNLIASIQKGGKIPTDINEKLSNYKFQLKNIKKKNIENEEDEEFEMRERKTSNIPEIAHILCKKGGFPRLKCQSTYSKWLLKRPQTLQTLVNSTHSSK